MAQGDLDIQDVITVAEFRVCAASSSSAGPSSWPTHAV